MQKSRQFASTRLPLSLKRKIAEIGRINRWSLSKTIQILIEEAVALREQPRTSSTNTSDPYFKLAESEGLR